MKQIFSNIALIFKNPKYSIAYILMVIIIGILWIKNTSFGLIYGNYGPARYYYDIFLSVVNILAFPLFILAWIYRSHTLGSYAEKKESIWFFGWILGILISGSLCCGSSVLLTFGASALTGMISASPFLPFHGMEIKTLGVIILLYSLYSLLSKLLVCERKNIKTPSKK